jgi:hypothetical protein
LFRRLAKGRSCNFEVAVRKHKRSWCQSMMLLISFCVVSSAQREIWKIILRELNYF